MPSGAYAPLANDHSTRLLTLHAGFGIDLLHADLSEVDLNDCPKYEAVSYTWGDELNQKAITVDGEDIAIRSNLWAFLRRLRKREQTRVLWIDALCISQNDLQEKSHQVSIIATIFRQATCVLAWLGEHENASETLFRPWSEFTTGRKILSYVKLLMGKEQFKDEAVAKPAEVWFNFLSRPYFRRTWIVQEIAAARQITVHCGHSYQSWSDLIESKFKPWGEFGDIMGPDIHLEREGEFRDLLRCIDPLIRLRKEPDKYTEPTIIPPSNVFELVENFATMECMDRRDRVYALLSMEDEAHRKDIIADYTMDIADLVVQILQRRLHQKFSDLWRPTTIFVLMRNLKLTRRDCYRVMELLEEKAMFDEQDFDLFQNWTIILRDLMDGLRLRGTSESPKLDRDYEAEYHESRVRWERLHDLALAQMCRTSSETDKCPNSLVCDTRLCGLKQAGVPYSARA